MKATAAAREAEQGFMLVGLIVAVFLILLALSVAAPRVSKELQREREVEAVHRGNEYVRAVQVYYRKNGHYPGSIEQLEKSNNVRYLRQRYPDPMTGKPDWKLIHVGEAKTTVKGFFGKPLSGMTGAGGIGSSIGSGGSVGPGTGGMMGSASGGSSFGSSSMGSPGASTSPGASSSSGSSFGSSSFGSPSTNSTDSGMSSSGIGAGNSTSSNGINGSQSATSFSGTGAPIMGVRSAATGNSIVVLNEQTTYPTWEFIYDPRIEQLKAKANLLGGGPATANSSSSFGSSGSSSSMNGTGRPGMGGSSSSGFGSSSSGSSSFGSSSFGSSSFGSSGSGSTPSSSPNPTQ